MIDVFRGLAIASLDLGVEEALELVVEDKAKILGKDVVIVAVADYYTEGIGGADTLDYEPFFLVDLGFHQFLLSIKPALWDVAHRGLDKLPKMEEHNHVVLCFKFPDKVCVNCWRLVPNFVKENTNTFDLPQLLRAIWSIQH